MKIKYNIKLNDSISNIGANTSWQERDILVKYITDSIRSKKLKYFLQTDYEVVSEWSDNYDIESDEEFKRIVELARLKSIEITYTIIS